MPRAVAITLGVEALVIAALLVVAADLYAHSRVEELGGVNKWGYRGPAVREKEATETRIALVGGDQAFSWGADIEVTLGAYLRPRVEPAISVRGEEHRLLTVLELGALGLPARQYDDRIRRFHGLGPDVVVFVVELSDDRGGPEMPPSGSGVAALTGYVPMLPVVLQEKGQRMSALPGFVASAAGRMLRAADAALYRLASRPEDGPEDRLVSVGTAVHTALGIANGVVVVLPIPRDAAERAERDRLREVVGARAAADARLALVDLSDQPALHDDTLLLDGRSYGARGRELMADAIAPAVVRVLPVRKAS